MMTLYYILLSIVTLSLGLYTRFAEPPARLHKWLLPKRAWFSNIFMAGAWAVLAVEEHIKATWPHFYSAHELTFFGTYIALVLVSGTLWVVWNFKHEKDTAQQSAARDAPRPSSRS